MKKHMIPVIYIILMTFSCINPAQDIENKDENTTDNPTDNTTDNPAESSTYTVTYDGQGATTEAIPSSQSIDKAAGKVSSLPVPPEKFTYTFSGWYTEENGGGSEFLVDTPVTSNMIVYAYWTQTAVVSTLAGQLNISTSIDGIGTSATFSRPFGVETDDLGNVYVADFAGKKIRKIDPNTVVTTLVNNSQSYSGLSVDSAGTVFATEYYNHIIRKVTAGGVISTLAGTSGSNGSIDNNGTSASFYFPFDTALDSSGNIIVADTYNNKIRKIAPNGDVTTLAGSGSQGSADGSGMSATFRAPVGITIDSSGNLYIADSGNHKIRKITPAGVVTTLAGSGSPGSEDGNGTSASFNGLRGIAVDSSGNLYVSDSENYKIRKISAEGEVITLAGTGLSGAVNGSGETSSFSKMTGIAVDCSGNVYIGDTENHLIRKITQ